MNNSGNNTIQHRVVDVVGRGSGPLPACETMLTDLFEDLEIQLRPMGAQQTTMQTTRSRLMVIMTIWR